MSEPDTEPKTTVFIVEDDEDVRSALELLFSSAGMDTRSFETGPMFLDAHSEEWHGCILLDMRLPEMGGLDIQAEINKREIDLPVIFLTGFGDTDTGVQAMKSGAFDFVQKPFNEQQLLDTVGRAFAANAQRREELAVTNHLLQLYESLTEREKEVLNGIVSGDPNKRIAGNLGLSEKTIEYHRAKLMEKMNARSLADLIKKTIVIETAVVQD